MSYLDANLVDLGAECQEDARVSLEVLERRADGLVSRLQNRIDLDRVEKARLLNELARTENDLERSKDAWQHAMEAFSLHLDAGNWEDAVLSCDILFGSGEPDSLVALGHSLWLSITYPVDPSLTLRQLMHVINDTPEDSDGAAVAAAMGAYVVEMRATGDQHSDLSLAVGQMLNDVARRHSNIRDQAEFDAWFKRLELDRPDRFLVRMRNVIDVLVQDQWWFDRDALQAELPVDTAGGH
jgi:hypothetical protein